MTLVFKGDYNLEKNLPITAADITDALDLGDACVGCKANAFALAGFLEAVEATNGFEKAVAKWKEIGCYFSVTGHGLGGAHAVSMKARLKDCCESIRVNWYFSDATVHSFLRP